MMTTYGKLASGDGAMIYNGVITFARPDGSTISTPFADVYHGEAGGTEVLTLTWADEWPHFEPSPVKALAHCREITAAAAAESGASQDTEPGS